MLMRIGGLLPYPAMTGAALRKDAVTEPDDMVETVSDYYRRRADEERQCADKAVDLDLRRIHLQRAACMQQMAEAARCERP